jgi:protein SMG6
MDPDAPCHVPSLAEADHRLLSLTLRPQVPTSLQSIPFKYNIPMHLWDNGFQRLLATLRIASATSPLAQEHLMSFIYYAYGFYTTLLEEENLSTFKNSWIEALGDLAWYQMTLAHSTAIY